MAKYKQKTHSGAKKRFRFSKTGKVKRGQANRSHILGKMTTKRKRHLRGTAYAASANAKTIHEMMPYGSR